MRFPAAVLAVCVAAAAGAGCLFRTSQSYSTFTIPRPLPADSTLVIGFMGGRASWDADDRWVRQLALDLRERDIPGLRVETVENSRKRLALRLVREAFDRNESGALEPEEKERVRLILYGQSFGGAAVVKTARRLDREGIPVILTVQIDSVGRNDSVIPPNVRRAANFYQKNGLFIRGEAPIRAADPSRTEILGNWKYDYSDSDIDISKVDWWKKLFQRAHAKMGHDPEVWGKAEKLILEAAAK